MCRVLLAAALVLGRAAPASAQQEPIRKSIQSQFDASLQDDLAAAFSLQPQHQGLFATQENFGAMVRQAYPMVHRPLTVRMPDLRSIAGNLWQRVMIIGAGGRTHLLDYMMVETPEGWQIKAVQLLPATGIGA